MAIARSIRISLLLLLLLHLLPPLNSAAAETNPAPTNATFPLPSSCPTSCGDVDIFYPFGVGDGCFRRGFDLICNTTSSPPKLFLSDGTTQVKQIALTTNSNYLVTYVHDVITVGAGVASKEISWAAATDGPYAVSTGNAATVVGCDAGATLMDGATNQTIGTCRTICGTDDVTDGACDGVGCCQISFSGSLKSVRVEFSRSNLTNQSPAAANSSVKVFISEAGFYSFDRRDLYGGGSLNGTTEFPIRMDWYIADWPTCEEAVKDEASYACVSDGSFCSDWGQTGLGYVCYCSAADGEANPYVPHGCDAGHKCTTGMCSKLVLGLVIGVSLGIGLLILIIMTIFAARKWKKMNQINRRKRFFSQNHGLLLQQLISSNEDVAARTQIFSLEEMEKATNNFDVSRVVGCGGHGTVYKGILLDQRVVAIKKSKIKVKREREISEFINEVAILSRINHRNIVRLYGCCLETEVPLLVYEFISNGTLYEHLHSRTTPGSSLSWEDRLRIATEVAGALAYLHSAATISILHRDVKSSNILLDEYCTSKVSDFGTSRLIPDDQTHVFTAVQGTYGYLDPEYYHTSQLTEKSDVYSFGVILLELLTGQKPISSEEGTNLSTSFLQAIKEGRHFELIDARMKNEGRKKELDEVALLATMCLSLQSSIRPTMREVEFKLRGLMNTRKPAVINKRRESGESLLVDQYSSTSSERYIPASFVNRTSQFSSRIYSLEEEFMLTLDYPR